MSFLYENDLNLMGTLCPIHPLKVNKVHAAEHFTESLSSRILSFWIWSLVETNVLEEEPGSVSTITMKELATSNFMVEKEGMINFYQSTWSDNQYESSLYRHCYKNLKYHSKSKNATSISSLVLRIASCPNIFIIFKIQIIVNLRWSHIPYQWQGEQTQCTNLVNRATTFTDTAPAWLSKIQHFLWGVPRESARPIFLHWNNCDWWLISRHVGKLVVTPIEHKLWRLHSATGRCSPHFHTNVRVLLNRVLQQRWIGRAAKGGNHLLPWPPNSPDLTPCDFFLWGFVNDSVYVPPLPMSLQELRDRITHALQTITADMINRVWDEFDYRVDLCRVTQDAHIEGLWLTHNRLGHLPLLAVQICPCKLRNGFLVNFWTCTIHLWTHCII